MASKTTILWRMSVLGLLAAAVPFGVSVYDRSAEIDTNAMLDVSVSIRTVSHVRRDSVGDSVWDSGGGSGFLVDAERCDVWTNYHVVDNAALIEVIPRGWERSAGIGARLVNAMPQSDFAVLRMESCDGLRAARLGNSDTVSAGEESYAVGNPLGRNPDSISRGIISHTERYLSGTVAFLQTDAAINPGNSGGALFNRRGEVIGINTAIAYTRSGANVGVGYAVPINTALEAAEALAAGKPERASAGFEDKLATLRPDEAEVFGVPRDQGAVIVTEAPGLGAAFDLIKPRDVIYALDGQPVTEVSDWRREIGERRAGDRVALALMRGGEAHTVELTLDAGDGRRPAKTADYFDGLLGMDLEMWRGREDERGRFETPVITRVYDLGPAHRAQIASSQRNIAYRGRYALSYMLDVKTVTGVVFDGTYKRVTEIADIETVVHDAHAQGAPVLLEIALWVREEPTDASSDMRHMRTAFFRVEPALSASEPPPIPDQPDADLVTMGSDEIDAQFWRPRELPARTAG